MIIEGTTYRSTDADWQQNALSLKPGDDIEYWDNENCGARGVLEAYAHNGLGVPGCWRSIIGYQGHPGEVDPRITEFTVRRLAPRTPSWAGAQVVRDALGRVWTINGDGHYDGPMTYKSAQLVGSWGDVTVLLDADGHIPVASLMEVNGVSRLELGLRFIRAMEGKCRTAENYGDAILAALEGKR